MGNFKRKIKRNNGPGYTPTPREARMLGALRTASKVLSQYAKGSNWGVVEGRTIWLGEGDGPLLAELALGTKKDPELWKRIMENKEG